MPSDDRIRQVKTTRERYGNDHYQKIGSAGGKNSPTKFNPDTASKAGKARWAKYREELARKEENGNETSNRD